MRDRCDICVIYVHVIVAQQTQECRRWACRTSLPWQLWPAETAISRCRQIVSRERFPRVTHNLRECSYYHALSSQDRNAIQRFEILTAFLRQLYKTPTRLGITYDFGRIVDDKSAWARTLMITCVIEALVNCPRFRRVFMTELSRLQRR